MTFSQLLLLAPLLVIFTACDLAWRRIPLLASLGGLVAALLFPWELHGEFWLGLALGAGLTILAGFPGGDWKAAAVLGAVAGPEAISAALALAFGLTLLRWRLKKTVAPEPWMPYILVSFLLILAAEAFLLPGRF